MTLSTLPRRLAVARLWHEGNSFSPFRTTAREFQQREWTRGAAAAARYRGTATEMGAAVAFADARPDWQVSFLRLAAAPPGGPLEQPLFESLVEEIAGALAAESWDAVYLSLHGALVAAAEPEADLALLRRVRAAIGRAPLAVTFDLHANLSPAAGPLIDILVGYKTYPHLDMAETGARALALLDQAASGRISPTVRIAKAGVLLTSHRMRTDAGPMAEIEAAAARLMAEPDVLDATPFGGFTYGDTPSAGASAAVTVDGAAARAESLASALAAAIRVRAPAFAASLPSAAEAIELALATPGPVAVLEPGDNPLSGGGADTPGLFRALLAARPPPPVLFAFFWDPDLVARAALAGPGAWISARLGGRLTPDYGPPLAVEARVLRLTDGRYVNEGPMERGLAVDQGPTAVLSVQGIEVVVTSACQAVNDPAWFALHGIRPESLRLLAVKAKNHFRAAFGQRFARLVDCDTPGPACLDPRGLPFRHLPAGLL
jgi:microcystin degradation protein MlrC